jgi:serine/threonine protein kinase/tetratricopeptide (TPR) repeat protein
MHSQHEKVEDLFSQALALPSGERTAFLEHACGQDAQLRERLTELLQATADAGQFLPDTPKDAPVEVGADTTLEQPGTHIGRYKLLEKIGEGGCGVVYMAEQEDPVRRKVALKIIKAGMDSHQVIARFEAERQALAMMDHPNIAQFFDAGTTKEGKVESEGGRIPPTQAAGAEADPSQLVTHNETHNSQLSPGLPYFVMELVRGVRITDYCTQNNLPTRQRLDLFIQVCHAVQHAHQKGIIHRDLKPSNILVTENDGKPVPKVIDFGIAKATEGQLTDKTVFTQFAAFMGTPAYMSPEQAAMTSLDIDTRSDIYSLGVLLYELLTGTTPFDAQELLKAGFDEMRRVIREVEPPTPSTRHTQVQLQLQSNQAGSASLLQSKVQNLKSKIEQDLDWIVMKCLEKDRKRRYETASGLAEDIQRHLTSELVTARPPSATYRFRKMVRRNRVVFATMTAVGSALILGAMVSTWQALRATRAERDQVVLRQKAEIEATKSRQVAQFLKDMIGNMKPSVAMGRDTTLVREFADQTFESLAKQLVAQPEVEIELRVTLGKLYNALGEYSKAETIHRETLPKMRSLRDQSPELLADLLRDYADVLNTLDKGKLAEPLAREALAISKQLHGEKHDNVVASLRLVADSLKVQHSKSRAEGIQIQALAMSRQLHGPEHSEVASQLLGLASLYSYQSKAAQAEPLFQEALAMRTRIMPETHPLVLEAVEVFAGFQVAQKNYKSAAELFKKLLSVQREVLGSENRMVALTLGRLASVLVELNPAEALPFVQQEVALRKRLHGEGDIEVAKALGDLGFVFGRLGKNLEETTAYQESLTIARKATPKDFRVLELVLQNLSLTLEYQGHILEAEAVDRERVEWARQDASNNPDRLEDCLYALADTLYRQRKYSDAEPFYREVMNRRRRRRSHQSEDALKPTASLARLLSDWAWQDRPIVQATPDPVSQGTNSAKTRAHEAENLLRECLELRVAPLKIGTNTYSVSFSGYSDKYKHSIGTGRLVTNVEPWSIADTRSRLGGAVLSVAFTDPSLKPEGRTLKLNEAEKLLLESNQVLQQSPNADKKYRRHALERLVRLYEAWNKPEEATHWRVNLENFAKLAEQPKSAVAPASPP